MEARIINDRNIMSSVQYAEVLRIAEMLARLHIIATFAEQRWKVGNEWKHILKIIDLLLMKYVSRMMNAIKSVLCMEFVIHRKVRKHEV